MKIHKVTMKGFGPYLNTETVDFDAFSDDGLFVITGKTGAGKSSILDAITFALFGDVPRYGSVTDDSVRSKYLGESAEETRVDVEFSQGDKRYRVSRTPSFTKPGNKNPSAPWAEIAEIAADGTETVLASRKIKDVGIRVSEIVRLNAEQFKQVILLAQGAFQEFLLAKSDKRREILRQLFDSRRFDVYSQDLDEQAKKLRTQLEHIATAVKAHAESLANELGQSLSEDFDGNQQAAIVAWATPLIAQQAELVALAKQTADAAEVKRAAAETALNEAKTIAANQVRKQQALDTKDRLSQNTEVIDRDRAALVSAQKADIVWSAIDAVQEAEAALEDAKTAHETALELYEAFHSDVEVTVETLKSDVQDLASRITKLSDVVAIEASLPKLTEARDAANEKVDAFGQKVVEIETELQALQETALELKTSMATATKVAEDLTPASQELSLLESQLKAATEAESHALNLEAAKKSEIVARESADLASRQLTTLKKQQYGQFAGVLAQQLVDGDPCAVCGSPSHPSPATLDAQHVKDEDVEAAEAAVDRARQAVSESERKVTEWKTKLDEAIKAAAGQSVAELTGLVSASQTRLEAAQTAKTQASQLLNQQERIGEETTSLTTALSEAKVALTEAKGHANQTDDELQANTAKVAAAREDFESVQARVEAIRAEHAATEKFSSAAQKLELASTGHEKALTKQTSALAQYEFGDVASVRSAKLSPSDQAAIKEKVQNHDKSLAIALSVLAEEALQNLPTVPVELAGLEQAYSLARDEKSAADETYGRVHKVQQSAEGLLASISKAFEDSGSAQKEYEVVQALAQAVRGQGSNTKRMTLETFALAADLEDIVAAANVLLRRMTAGRYELRYSDERAKGNVQSGLGLEILDAYNEERRPPESLSGGEKFQASLALALGLAEVVTSRNGGVRLDTLFIDEGFGALDDDTLSEVLDTIDALREGGRTVGLISHVDKVKERIPHHINVSVTSGGWSTLAS